MKPLSMKQRNNTARKNEKRDAIRLYSIFSSSVFDFEEQEDRRNGPMAA